eukprot:gene3154-3684_t
MGNQLAVPGAADLNPTDISDIKGLSVKNALVVCRTFHTVDVVGQLVSRAARVVDHVAHSALPSCRLLPPPSRPSLFGGGKGRLFRTHHCSADECDVVVKVYYKRGVSDVYARHSKKLQEQRDDLAKCDQHGPQAQPSNICFYRRIMDAKEAGYVVRPYFHHRLAALALPCIDLAVCGHPCLPQF